MESQPFLVRVLRPYNEAEENEVNLDTDDVVRVLAPDPSQDRDDRHWIRVDFDNSVGYFPRANVVPIPVTRSLLNAHKPQSGKVFIAKEAFVPEEASDLSLARGCIVLGHSAADDNWWEGTVFFDIRTNQVMVNGKPGLFPVTHVYELPLSSASESLEVDSRVSTYGNHLHNSVAPESTTFRKLAAGSSRKAVVTVAMTAQLEEEIDLVQGHELTIYGSHDDLFYYGQSHDGKVGIFPKSFVRLERKESLCDDDQPPSYETAVQTFQSEDESVTRGQEQGITSYGMSLYPFQGEYANELTFKSGEIIHLIRHVDSDWIEGELNGAVGILPRSFINIVVDVHDYDHFELDAKNSYASEQEGSPDTPSQTDFPPDTYARVLVDFSSDVDGDLHLKEGTTITLIRKIGEDWIEAVDDSSNVGFCPASYVEIIADPNQSMHETQPSISIEEPLPRASSPENQTLENSVGSFDPSHSDFEPRAASSPRPSAEASQSFSLRDITIPRTSPSRPAPQRPTVEVTPSQQKERPASCEFGENGGGVPAADPSDKGKERRKSSKTFELRSCILTELLQSEKDYLQHLRICHSLLEKPAKRSLDFASLLGNLADVIDVSSELNSKLGKSIDNWQGRDVAACFLSMAGKLRPVYATFCQNSKDVQTIWSRISSPEAPADVKETVQRINDRIRAETNSFDLPSLLIKPIQRILKYPLLLSELVKCAIDEEEASQLAEAVQTMTRMASEINEYKRRRELVTKYRKSESSSFSTLISKITMHTVRKKSSRLGFKISSKMGFHAAPKDPEFDKVFMRFKSLEKTIKIFLKDLLVLIEHQDQFMKFTHSFALSVADFHGEKRSMRGIDLLLKSHKEICEVNWSEMKKLLKHNVIEVVQLLLLKFEGANRLTQKRNDKMADYDAHLKKQGDGGSDSSVKNGAQKEEEMKARQDYEGLNNQLMDELPQLTTAATEIFKNCLAAFLKIKKLFIGKTARSMLSLLDLSSSTSGSFTDIQETFQVQFNLIVDDLLRDFRLIPPVLLENSSSRSKSDSVDLSASLPSSFSTSMQSSPPLGGKQINRLPQSTNDKESLSRRFRPEDVFRVAQDHFPVDKMEISVRKNEIVGVIKKHNPMGNSLQWFVDSGSVRGLIPAKFLEAVPQEGPPLPPKTQSLDPPCRPQRQQSAGGAKSQDLLSFEDPDGCASSSQETLFAEFDPLTPSCSSSQQTHADRSIVSQTKQNKRHEDALRGSELIGVGEVEDNGRDRKEREDGGETFVAQYRFDGAAKGTISLHVGQFVKLKAKSDLNGNCEWNLVTDSSGKTGYVPANYIVKAFAKD